MDTFWSTSRVKPGRAKKLLTECSRSIPSGAKSRAHGEVTLAPMGAHKKEIRDVGAGNEQNEAHSTQEHEERWTDGSDQLFVK